MDYSWIKNAFKKKNNLYRRFLKCRLKEAEIRYKSYKNKLTGILRYCEKEYCNKKLQLYRNDMKNTWKLLNGVMNRKMKESNFVSHFNYNDEEIYDKQDIANGFNDFFVNIGPELANKIVSPENNDVLQYMNDSNVKVEGCNEPSCEALIFSIRGCIIQYFFYHMHIALNYKTE